MKTRKITKVAVIGAGTMGHSIAQVFAQNGISTSLVDRDSELLENARNLIKSNLDTLAEYGKIKHQDIPGALSRLRTTTDYGSACRDTDFVLEAVNEVPEVKQEAFSLLERYCRADTILASNTSGLDIYRLLTFHHAERVIIAHWFAPPHIIPLVEVVPGQQTEGEVVDCTARFLSDLGKRPLVMKQYVHSFIVNRLQNFITAAMWEILSNGWAIGDSNQSLYS